MPKDIKTRAYVLRRTNYGEADRILNLITPEGKVSAIAKGVRKAKSRLAGGVEMFVLSEINLHQGKSDLMTVTGAKMLKYHSQIVTDLERMELAAEILKRVSRAAESTDNPEYFKITEQGLAGIDSGINLGLVECWSLMNLAKASGEEVNAYRDINGNNLDPQKRYTWDISEMALAENTGGPIGVSEIKTMRLILTADLAIINKIKGVGEIIPELLKIAYMVARK
ncbi:DNA repair protein RecO [Candidatus Saccharibacteria bacterium]|nr:DNA repair protein RecO [Candidatus Saccharibacteria bacterium]